MAAPWVKCHVCREVKLTSKTWTMFVTRSGKREEMGRICEACAEELERRATEITTTKETTVRRGGVTTEKTKTSIETNLALDDDYIRRVIKALIGVVAIVMFLAGVVLGGVVGLMVAA